MFARHFYGGNKTLHISRLDTLRICRNNRPQFDISKKSAWPLLRGLFLFLKTDFPLAQMSLPAWRWLFFSCSHDRKEAA